MRTMGKNNSMLSQHDVRLIESDAFPFEFLSALALRESWRKEIFRPIYHIHKWWANRLGSVFRGILLGCLLPEEADLESAFYNKYNFYDTTIFDPFIGSGTTIGEAHKLGCITLGRDINPVACESVRVALGPMDRYRLQSAFSHLSATVGERIRDLYRSRDENGRVCDVLYWFWVKQAPCPHCDVSVDLFQSRVIARNAYPDRKPEIQVCCPQCGDVFQALNNEKLLHCNSCLCDFAPDSSSVKGASATCPACSGTFSIAESIRRTGHPPTHRLYAKLLLTPDEKKRYLPATQEDLSDYETCSEKLRLEIELAKIRLPTADLNAGHNTRQAINYNYFAWRDFFNDRQLLALGWLYAAIAELPDHSTRDALLNLFSGILEFNNMFASYKGEGTGAVRHMFSTEDG
jgi:putative DNA methylase